MLRLALGIIALSATSLSAFAAGDRLTPDEVQTTGIEANPHNESGLYLGAGMLFGQGRTTEPSASTGVAAFGKADIGYQVHRGSWNRLEAGVELLSGTVSYSLAASPKGGGDATTTVNVAVLAKAAYGYSLGTKIYGLLTGGLGPAYGKFALDDAIAGKLASDTKMGLAWQLGWEVVAPISDALDLTGGLSLTQINFNISSLSAGSATYPYSRNVIATVPAVDLGLRLRL